MQVFKPGQFRLAELLSSLSYALDLTEGQAEGHCVRCCWIGLQIGRKLELDDAALSDLYYALLLKDLGCSSNAARICSHYLVDDLTFKRAFKEIDGSLPQALQFILSHTGMQAGMAERFKTLVHVMRTGGDIGRELIETRCNRGADIAIKMRFNERVADTIRNLDEHWDGTGLPEKKSGKDIPLFSQIALMAQVIDVFFTAHSPATARNEILSRRGTWFSPELVDIFSALISEDLFWSTLSDGDLQEEIYKLEPGQAIRFADEDYLDDISQAFAQVVDSKSPFTAGHSERVTVFADMIAGHMNFSEQDRRWLRRGALLHDIGKLGVSNSVLDKPDKLNDEEFAQIKLHPVYSGEILQRIDAFSDLAPIAAGHHERLDGKGYPNGLCAKQIDLPTRIVTVADIFDALTADRPYRAAMPLAKALGIMSDIVDSAIDPQCFAALKNVVQNFEENAA